MMKPPDLPCTVGLLGSAGLAGLLLAGIASAQTIYTCVDGNGRRLTSDRPIPACLDREQRELNRDGTLKRTVQPPPTASERAAQDARLREQKAEEQKLQDVRRKERALLLRYPNQAAHDDVRRAALAEVDARINAAKTALADLYQRREKLNEEMEFYVKDPARAPRKLQRDVQTNDKSVRTQLRVMDDEKAEQGRINARFDEELQQLKRLWATPPSAGR